jgi:hypothetical protein
MKKVESRPNSRGKNTEDQGLSTAMIPVSKADALQQELLLAKLPEIDRKAMQRLLDAASKLPPKDQQPIHSALSEILTLYVARVESVQMLSDRLAGQATRQAEILTHDDELSRKLHESEQAVQALQRQITDLTKARSS